MATSKEARDFILEQTSLLDSITARPMMGEYLLYNDGLLFGGIYDERVLVKIVEENRKYNLEEVIPYKGAKAMYFVEDIENRELVRDIIIDTCKGLSLKRKK